MIRIENAIARERERRKADWNNLGRTTPSASLQRPAPPGASPVNFDLRPGKIDPANESGIPGREYPFWVSIKGNDIAFVSSIRDREIDTVEIS